MSATTKKKQDDKNLKRLRELVSSPENKKCADCRTRGPTYADMAVNSFVCTTCSGLLRGLNPPHRVKSITMTSFTVDEMARLEGGGNEKLNNIWLARWNERSDTEPDAGDDQRMKYFMVEKYERKRWYDEGGKSTGGAPAVGNATPEPKPLSALLGNQAPRLVVTNKPASPMATNASPILLAPPDSVRRTNAPPAVVKASTLAQTAAAPDPAAPQVNSLLDLNDVFSTPAQPPPFGGVSVFPPGGVPAASLLQSGGSSIAGGNTGAGGFAAFQSAQSVPGSQQPVTSMSDKYSVFSGFVSTPEPAVSTAVTWGGSNTSSINWSSGGLSQPSNTVIWGSVTSSAPSSGMNWGQPASSVATNGGGGARLMQQSQNVSNPFGGGGGGSGGVGVSAQPQQMMPSQSNPNPFGDIGNIGGMTRGPASAVQFTGKPPQTQTQTVAQAGMQQPMQGQMVGNNMWGRQQQPVVSQQQPTMGWGGQTSQSFGQQGFQQQPQGFQQQSGFGQPQQNAFGQSGFGQPQQSGFGQPQQSGFGQPQQSGFGQLQQSGFGQPQQNAFGQPKQNAFGQPQQNAFGQPKQNAFGQPQQNAFGQPQQSGFGQPQQSGFGQPQQSGFGQPQQSGFGQPQQSGFGQPQQSEFGQFGAPTQNAVGQQAFGSQQPNMFGGQPQFQQQEQQQFGAWSQPQQGSMGQSNPFTMGGGGQSMNRGSTNPFM